MHPEAASQAATGRVSVQRQEESFTGFGKPLLTLCINTSWHYFSLLHPGAAKHCDRETRRNKRCFSLSQVSLERAQAAVSSHPLVSIRN